jgi:acyl-[acyl-carrier-protein]-phospholipid O-acyltransferase/long-chain-fatty-acid--[acyl-carrier-protein] ligase
MDSHPKEKTSTRGLWPLLITQFFGAFNDNAWKLIVFTLATRSLIGQASAEDLTLGSQLQASLSMLSFLIPMMLFSIPSGILADRFSKRTVIVGTKILELILMSGACTLLFFNPQGIFLPYLLLALMGLQSALFGPSKYGILPEILPKEKLAHGNGLIEMWTMLAIIAGTGFGPILLLLDAGGSRPEYTWYAAAFLLGFACIGLIASYFIPKVPPASSSTQAPLSDMKEAWKIILKDHILLLSIAGLFLFWFVISLLGQNVLVYAKTLVEEIGKGEFWLGIPPASFGLGIGIGAMISGRMSGERIEYGLIPLGSIGFAIFSSLLGLTQPEMGGMVIILILMGISSGLITVPLHSISQVRAPAEKRGAVIALENFFSISSMILGSLLAAGMALVGMNMQIMLVISSVLVIYSTLWAVTLLPEALMRLGFILLTKTFYRLRVYGETNIPKEGAALLVCNHMSVIDAFFLLATVGRRIRFIMKKSHYDRWWIKPLARLAGAIPVASDSDPRTLLRSMRDASKFLDQGELVCIFPEGQTSRTGMILPFHRGAELLLKGRNCPIIPIFLDRVWGSIFSYERGRYYTKSPQGILKPVTVTYGEALDSKATIDEMRRAVMSLSYKAWIEREQDSSPIHHALIHHTRRSPWKLALADQSTPKVSRLKLLASAIALANSFIKIWKEEETIGILLPTSIAGVTCNLAATLSGKVIVNLNYTTGKEQLHSAIEQSEIKTVISSSLFIRKLKLELPESTKLIKIEEHSKKISKFRKISALLFAFSCPTVLIDWYCGNHHDHDPEQVLTTIFTSGSTSQPKGVMLSHFNVDSNLEAVAQVTPVTTKPRKLLHCLPLFHSFGYLSMWLGLNHGIPLLLHYNPLEPKPIGELIRKHEATLLFSTPTFLRQYLRRMNPVQFGSIELVLTGAEKLPTNLADEFETTFGIRPIQGYGVTECAPVIATNTLDVRANGVYQIGSKEGTVGHTVPGVLAKIVDPDTFVELPFELEGMLLVKGPNVMKGYLKQEKLTQESFHDSWYITGDIAMMDTDGFIRITDRVTRFSKIGGEMVPHGKVEEALQELSGTHEQVFAVTSVSDRRKGERLAVLHRCSSDLIKGFIERLSAQGLPKLFIPKAEDFIHVESIPILASGKLDLKTLKQIARENLKV